MDPSNYQLTTVAYLEDCRRRGLRPATIRYYDMVLRRFATATETAELSGLTIKAARDFQDHSPTLAIRCAASCGRSRRSPDGRRLRDSSTMTRSRREQPAAASGSEM